MNTSSNIIEKKACSGRSYQKLELVIKEAIMHLNYLSSDKPTTHICNFPDEDLRESDVRALIHTLIFFMRISDYEYITGRRAYFARAYVTKEIVCCHGTNCPYVIGNSLYIWACKKFNKTFLSNDPRDEGKNLPDYYEKFSGCGFFHSPSEIDQIRSEVDTVLYQLYDEFNNNFIENRVHPVDIAFSRIKYFVENHKAQGYPVQKIRLFKLTDFSPLEMKDIKKRSYQIDRFTVYNDNIFLRNTIFPSFSLKSYFDSKEKESLKNLNLGKNRSNNPYEYFGSAVPDASDRKIFPTIEKVLGVEVSDDSDEEFYEDE